MPSAVRRLASIAAATTLGALALAATASAENAGLTPVEPKSPNAEAINQTYYLLLGVTGAVLLAVEIALIVFVIRYRRGRRPVDAEGPQIHGNNRLEILWTVVPVLLVATIVAFVFYKLPEVSDPAEPASAAPADASIDVEVVGRQFYWEFRYPDGSITYDTLVVPVGRTVELDVTAPDFDVLHAWWVPSLGGKIDAIPGKVNETWFRAEEEGLYEGSCTEFCGVQHGEMRLAVRAVAPERWESELARYAGNGQLMFQATCAKCHNLEGPQLIGPTLGGNPTLGDRAELATIVRQGRKAMPAVGRGWSREQMDTLLEYTRQVAEAGG